MAKIVYYVAQKIIRLIFISLIVLSQIKWLSKINISLQFDPAKDVVNFDELQNQKNNLEASYSDLKSKYQILDSKYGEVKKQYDKRQNQTDELKHKYSNILESKYQDLKSKYNHFERKYKNMQFKHTNKNKTSNIFVDRNHARQHGTQYDNIP